MECCVLSTSRISGTVPIELDNAQKSGKEHLPTYEPVPKFPLKNHLSREASTCLVQKSVFEICFNHYL